MRLPNGLGDSGLFAFCTLLVHAHISKSGAEREFFSKLLGIISPRNVITNVENTKAAMPAKIELDSNVISTLIETFPQRTAARTKFEFLRRPRTRIASRSPAAT